MKKMGVTLAEVFSAWEDDAAKRGVTFGSQRVHRGYFDNHIGPALGGREINKISKADIINARTLWGKKVSPSMVRQLTCFVSTLYNTARTLGLADCQSPVKDMRGIWIPQPRRTRYLEADEIEAVLADLKGRDLPTYRMAAISAYAGLRLNEVLQLCPSRISLFNGTFRVRRKAPTGQAVESIVHFPKHLTPILQAMLDEKSWLPDEKFFKSLNRDSYQRALAASRINEGRSPKDRTTWVCFHSLRHSFASLACANGVDIGTISTMLGHRSLLSTMIYLKTSEKQINAGISKIEAAFKEGDYEEEME